MEIEPTTSIGGYMPSCAGTTPIHQFRLVQAKAISTTSLYSLMPEQGIGVKRGTNIGNIAGAPHPLNTTMQTNLTNLIKDQNGH